MTDRKKGQYLCLLLVLLLSTLGHAQITPERRTGSQVIDDTTKQVYGPRTSRYYYESDVFFNRDVLHPVDTAITNFHRNASFVAMYNYLYQDLGNIGTAIRPIYYQPPAQTGVRPGFDVYNLYWETEQIRYYDTKSPYTNMKLVLGGKGRSITRATYSRNINPQWNFGFTYRGIFADKQLQYRKNVRNTRSNYYDLYTTYQTKDSTYRIFVNFRRMYHRVNEFGGVRVQDSTDLFSFFDINAKPWLTTPSTEDLRTNFHLFHQYTVGSGLQFYHVLDRYKQKNKFLDKRNAAQAPFFDFTLKGDSIGDAATLRTVRNEVGIKGNLLKLFYNGYVALRHHNMVYNHLPVDTLNLTEPRAGGDEFYLGGRMSLDLDSLVQVRGSAEWMLFDRDKGVDRTTGGTQRYRIQGSIRSRWFEARATQMEYSPAFVAQAYRGSHDYWDNLKDGNGLRNIQVSQLNGYLHYRNSVLNLSPGMTFTRLHNYVFFDQVTTVDTVQQVLPVQSDGTQLIAAPEARLAITFFRHLTWSNRAIYSLFLENADDAIRVPELFVNSQLAYANIFFKGNLDMQAGIDLHWTSAYYAQGYDPAIMQFYNQDIFESPAFPLVDVFVNARIKRARIFFKYNNVMQIIRGTGYFPTPYYPGQRNIFDFGFDWSFYD